jgi:hypothetical protein
MGKIVIYAILACVCFFLAGVFWLFKRRWGRWLVGSLVWAALLVGAVGFTIETDRRADYWQGVVDKDQAKVDYQRGIMAQLQKGETPSTDCPYTKFDSYNCWCVGGEDAAERNTTNAKRKPGPKGLSCLDVAGLQSESAEHDAYLTKYKNDVGGDRKLRWAGVGGAAFLVVLMPVMIVRSRRAARREAGITPGIPARSAT